MTLCACGCGKEVKEGNKYIWGHNNKGIHFSDEHKRRISKSESGKIVLEKSKMYGDKNPMKSIEVRKKVSDTLKGKFFGKNHPMYGKHHTKDSKEKNREKHLGKKTWNKGISPSKETREKSSKSHLGKKQLESTKLKLHIANKGRLPGHSKGIYYDSPLQGKIWLRSTYELAYVKYLDSKKVLWYYEIETFDLGDTTYTPDFFLPQFEKFIEIKGFMRKEAQEKINKFKDEYPWNLEILYKEDLIKLGVKI